MALFLTEAEVGTLLPMPVALEAVEAFVERRVYDLEHAGGALADEARDAVPVHGLPREGAQDEQVE